MAVVVERPPLGNINLEAIDVEGEYGMIVVGEVVLEGSPD
jgi:hypothetical protein